MLTLQTVVGAPVTTTAGTFALFALFFSLAAHVAAWNALGDVGLEKMFAIGPVPAAIAVVFTSFGWSSFVAPVFAPDFDFSFVKYLYGRSTRLSACVIVIHFVISVLLGLVLFGFSATLLAASL